MSSAKITTIGFYNWMQSRNDNLFSKMNLPVGIDKDTLIDNILLRAGEFEVLYSNPFVYQNAIGVWSDKHKRTFEKWINALSMEYNPIENYDRKEEWEDKIANQTLENTNGKSSGNTSGSNRVNGSSENNKSAYDSDGYQPESRNTYETIGTDTSNTSTNIINTINKDESNNLKHNGRVHGNIGVTTTQQMLESELSLAAWNVYEHITDLFIEEFCIAIYW